jgi:hypothetical protein
MVDADADAKTIFLQHYFQVIVVFIVSITFLVHDSCIHNKVFHTVSFGRGEKRHKVGFSKRKIGSEDIE